MPIVAFEKIVSVKFKCYKNRNTDELQNIYPPKKIGHSLPAA